MNVFAAANATAPSYPIGILQAGQTGYPQGSSPMSANVTARPDLSGDAHYSQIEALFDNYWQTKWSADVSHYFPLGEPVLEGPAPNAIFLPHLVHVTLFSESPRNAVLARLSAVFAREITTANRIGVTQGQDRLASYAKYETENWDGFDADPITADTRRAAKGFLDSLPKVLSNPAIAPTADGAIALEWIWKNGNLHKLFIDIGPGSVWKGYWRRANGQRGVLNARDIELGSLKFDLAGLVRRLNR
ncbi:hypothetical protein FJ930_26115 [Mesorhizobium sp. B2-4-15]|uniref:hypothetical protein n=1 Tax=Mesorhizobium sp. B2-4-15 TaxID=2589934 RepID=UPI00114E8E92|nr:hypothetical protein [Mesorhizobium sp. B2-4-15]TPK63858.1 hypothetical protein FJ930_26115 [Mesorhizobium sp. B2-4-15]